MSAKNSRYIILPWDSEFFSISVAQIAPEAFKHDELEGILHELKRGGVSLAYWAVDVGEVEAKKAAERLGGVLVDRKVTYGVNLDQAPPDRAGEDVASIRVFDENIPSAKLFDLALQSGVYSRFNVDPKIPNERFESLYRIWIERSVNRTVADIVYVSDSDGQMHGMITAGQKNGCGFIGLLAVDESMRGRNIGMALVDQAKQWFVEKGLKYAEVVTQGDNVAGCRLYEKCGFKLEKASNFFHFWL